MKKGIPIKVFKQYLTKSRKQEIQIDVLPLEHQRFPTLGDYFFDKEKILHFKITDTGNHTFNKIILVHELVEQILTEAKGIKETSILKYDLEFEKLRENGQVGQDEEPGEGKGSPYRQEHLLAEIIERLILNNLNQCTFKEYTEKISKIFDNANNK